MAIRPTPILSATEEKWLILDQHSNSTGIVVSKANFKRHPEYEQSWRVFDSETCFDPALLSWTLVDDRGLRHV